MPGIMCAGPPCTSPLCLFPFSTPVMSTSLRTVRLLAAAALFLTAGPALAQDTTATPPPAPADTADTSAQTEAAEEAAQSWLAHIDEGDLAESHATASALLTEQMPEAQWVSAIEGVKAQMGEVGTRELASAQYTTTLPNAPAGEYVVLSFNTAFANAQGTEVLVMHREDGTWKAAGYVVRPAGGQ